MVHGRKTHEFKPSGGVAEREGRASRPLTIGARSPGRLAAAAIRGYQRWISPYKGYVCAHRHLHGRHSCSEFARLAILDRGLTAAWPDIRQQFRDCRAAALFLREQRRAAAAADDAESDPDIDADSDGYELDQDDGADRRRPTIDDRFYEESEKKRKRLSELPSNETPLSGASDWCYQCGTCGFLESLVCCSPW